MTDSSASGHQADDQLRVAPIVAPQCPLDGLGIVFAGRTGDQVPAGSCPPGFVPVRALWCKPSTWTGLTPDNHLYRTVTQLECRPVSDELMHALQLPDEPESAPDTPRVLIEYPAVFVLLVDANERAYRPRIARNATGDPRAEIREALANASWSMDKAYNVEL